MLVNVPNYKNFSHHQYSIWYQIPVVQKPHSTLSQHSHLYWQRLWPASIALSKYIIENGSELHGQQVVELGAGIGLPSLVAGYFAQHVISTDYQPECLPFIAHNAAKNNLHNIQVQQADWHDEAICANADIILASDIFYNPGEFEILHQQFEKWVNMGKTIWVSTPHRLSALPMIESIQQWVSEQTVYEIATDKGNVLISLYVLQLDN